MTEKLHKAILDNLFDGVYFVDLERRITYWNRGAERISGFGQAEVQGKRCSDNILMHVSGAGTELCLGHCPLAQTMIDGKSREAEVFLHHKSGHRVPVAVRISPLLDDDGNILGAVEIFSDASNRLKMMSELKELKLQTQIDPLTGLGNRRRAELEFDCRMSELVNGESPFGLLFVDIDNFKRVNDTYGHEVGDRALMMVAKTLTSALRTIDSVCRWGGEEFVALVPKIDEPTFRLVAERVRRLVETSPLPVNDGTLLLTVSIGGAMAAPYETLKSLASRADAMMYQAKTAGRNCVAMDCSA